MTTIMKILTKKTNVDFEGFEVQNRGFAERKPGCNTIMKILICNSASNLLRIYLKIGKKN